MENEKKLDYLQALNDQVGFYYTCNYDTKILIMPAIVVQLSVLLLRWTLIYCNLTCTVDYDYKLYTQVNSKTKSHSQSPLCQPVFAIQEISPQQQKTERDRAKQLYHEQVADAACKKKFVKSAIEKNRQMEAEQLQTNREE